MKINKIFLDLDGVIRDWCGGIFKMFDCPPVKIEHWNDMTKYVCTLYGISEEYFWDKQDYNFWYGLKMYPYAQDILDLLPIEKTCILTSPTLTSAGGTQRWIESKLPILFKKKQYLIGPAKHFCASSDALLIDDNDLHVETFRKAGGHAILFSQPWNENRLFKDKKIETLRHELQNFDI